MALTTSSSQSNVAELQEASKIQRQKFIYFVLAAADPESG